MNQETTNNDVQNETTENIVVFNNIDNKLESLLAYKQHEYSLGLFAFSFAVVVFICILIYKFIANFVEF